MNLKNYLFLICLMLFASNVKAQIPCSSTTTNGSGGTLELYWVGDAEDGGNGDWNEPCSWRVGSVSGTEIPAQAPRPKDNIHFVDASFTAAGTTVSVTGTTFCGSITMDATFTNPFTFSQTGTLNIGDATNGGFNLPSTANATADITGILQFVWNGSHDIDLSDQTLNGTRLWFSNIAGTFNLQSDLNITGNTYAFASNAPFRLIAGTVNTNNHTINVPSILANNTDNTLNAGTSTFNLDGALRVPNSGSRKAIFSGGGFQMTNAIVNINRTDNANIQTAASDAYGIINFNNIGFNSQILGTLNSTNDISIGENIELITRVVTTTGNIILHAGSGLKLFNNLTVGGIVQDAGVNCAGINIINTTSGTKRITSTNDINLHDVSIHNVHALNSASGGCSSGTVNYVLTDAINLGNANCWDITTLAPRTLNWTGGGTDDLWTNPNNWDLGCVPNSQDDVIFANMNGKTVELDVNANVNDMTWVADGSTGTFISPSNSSIDIQGNLTLNPTMNWNLTSAISFFGSANTMDFSTQTLDNSIIVSGAYTLLSNLDNSTKRLLFNGTSFTANNKIIDINDFYVFGGSPTLTIDNTTINLHGDEGWYDYHGGLTVNNTGSTLVNFLSNNPRITGRGELGNRTFNIPSFTTVSGSTLSVFRNETAILNTLGDVTIGGDVLFNGNGIAAIQMKDITINGNLSIQSGHRTLFAGGTGRKLTITGSLNLSGTTNCTTTTEVRTIDGSGQIEVDIQGGTSGLDYVTLQNMDADGYASPTASNVIDLGGNDNWNFTGTTASASNAKTYYWRADATAPTTFDGDWNDPNHWTITQTNIVGDGSCSVPTSLDNVVFDNLSHDGTITEVTALNNFYCHDFTVNNSNMRFVDPDGASFFISGSIATDATYQSDSSTAIQGVNYFFTSTDPAGETIAIADRLRQNVFFASSGSWTLMDDLSMQSSLVINNGNLTSNGYTITVGSHIIINSTGSTVDLTGSIINCGDRWDLRNAQAINFLAPDDLRVRNMYPQNYSYKTVTSNGAGNFQILEPASASFERVDINVNSNIQGSNTFDVLNYIPTNGATRTHLLQEGMTQTISSPGGQVLATGLSNGFLNIKSSGSGQATIHKDHGDQMCWDFVILENLDATQDTDDNTPVPNIFGGINNTTTNLGGTLFDFSRSTFIAPTVNSGPDQEFCRRAAGTIEYEFQNSGPYTVTYTDGTNVFTESGISHGTASIRIMVFESTVYTVTSVEGDNCGSLVAGTIIDATQEIIIPPVSSMALNGDTTSCHLGDEGAWIHYVSGDGNSRSMVSALDVQDGAMLGNIDVTVGLENGAYVDNALSENYMKRHVGIESANNGDGKIRLYFTQQELDDLSTDVTGSPGNLVLSDLRVRLYNNNTLDFSGGHQDLTVTNFGDESLVPLSEALDFTSDANVFFVEVDTNSFGHFTIFADTATLSTANFEKHDFIMFPNPASTELNIKTTNGKNIESVKIYDMLGKLIMDHTGNGEPTQVISVETLASGIYNIVVTADNATVKKKLIVKG